MTTHVKYPAFIGGNIEEEEMAPQYCVSLGVGPQWCSDAPHAALFKLVSPHSHSTESRGVGKQEKLSVVDESNVIDEEELLNAAERYDSVKISFELHLTELTEARWETLLLKKRLYIQVPSCLLPEGSKEGFISLLEYAEEVLHCTDIIVCMKKDRADRAQLIRTFMFLGFTVLTPGHVLIPHNSDNINLYMRYTTE
ncbi:LOW QUALITY PROTEIN: ornithine decarboxylase antizyme 1 [Macrosteles quadrilineatus]|uniref:LOW QUALITY PROTEIN: ornithine decarboxylase antizyme 1 n=1 Tax=Macrosteles quadrilineatus TaxID=74068 RepID=UPI0023E20004|nr:LOW QUALITY PROTEIN: ornithine decarboxylase antizyme 1 [Macrosteles quadrilineatus]